MQNDCSQFLLQIKHEIQSQIEAGSRKTIFNHFKVVRAVTEKEIRSCLKLYHDQIVVLHFDGRNKQLKDLRNFLKEQHLPNLRLLHLSLGPKLKKKAPFQHGTYAIVRTWPQAYSPQSNQFQIAFYRHLANGHQIDEAYTAAQQLVVTPKNTNKKINVTIEGSESARQWNFWEECFDSEPVKDITPVLFSGSTADDLAPEKKIPPDPFPGLKPYSEKYGRVFWGRDIEIRNLLYLIANKRERRIITLVGQPGVGKTSLIEAGFIPRLSEESPFWRSNDEFLDWEARLVSGAGHKRVFEKLCTVLGQKPTTADTTTLLPDYVSQFSKHIVFCFDELDWQIHSDNPGDRQDLVKLFEAIRSCLPPTYSQSAKPIKFLLSIRTDSLPYLLKLINQAGFYFESNCRKYTLFPMTVSSIRHIIKETDKNNVLEISQELEEHILHILLANRGESPVAPYLQMILWGLWKYKHDTTPSPSLLFVDDYKKMVAQHKVFDDFFQAKYETLRHNFPALVRSGLLHSIFGLPSLYTQNQIDQSHLRQQFPNYSGQLQQALPKLADLYLLSRVQNNTTLTYQFGHPLLAPTAYNNLHNVSRRFERVRWRWAQARSLGQYFNGGNGNGWSFPSAQAFRSAGYIRTSEAYYWLMGLATFFVITLFLLVRAIYNDVDLAPVLTDLHEARVFQFSRLDAPESLPEQLTEMVVGTELLHVDREILIQPVEWLRRSQSTPFAEGEEQVDALTFGRESNVLFEFGQQGGIYQRDLAPLLFQTTRFPKSLQFSAADAYGLLEDHLLIGDGDGTVTHYNLEDMSHVALLPHPSAIRFIGSSPAHDAIFTMDSGQQIKIYELSGQQPRFVQNIDMGPVRAAAIHFGQTRLACATLENKIIVWDWAHDSQPYESATRAPVSQLVFHPDGNQLLSATTDGSIEAWPIKMNPDAAAANALWHVQAPSTATILAYSPNGAVIIASWGDDSLRLWDSKSFQPLGSIESEHGPIHNIDFSPDGKWMAMATDGAIEFWEVTISAEMVAKP
ncbi:MAG: hypothetical protein KDE50_23070 [Caldilineaceae bacterium]|nr:hypothetical protein [Caldilineaceae bacterium]